MIQLETIEKILSFVGAIIACMTIGLVVAFMIGRGVEVFFKWYDSDD